MKGRVLTPGRLVTNCLVQHGAYLEVPNPLGCQLVPGVIKQIQRRLVLIKRAETNKMTQSTKKEPEEGPLFYFTYFNHKTKDSMGLTLYYPSVQWPDLSGVSSIGDMAR